MKFPTYPAKSCSPLSFLLLREAQLVWQSPSKSNKLEAHTEIQDEPLKLGLKEFKHV